MIVKQAEADLGIEFNSSIYIAIMDHINYALVRAKQGMYVKNELLWEIKRTYKREYEAALNTLSIIAKQTGISLPQDEAGTIAIHYFNAEDPSHHIKESYRAVEIIQDIIKIIQYFFKIEFDENDMNYNRLMTHLRYIEKEYYKEDVKRYLNYLRHQIQQSQIELQLRKEVTPEEVKELRPDCLFIAIGASEIKPRIQGIDSDCRNGR